MTEYAVTFLCYFFFLCRDAGVTAETGVFCFRTSVDV